MRPESPLSELGEFLIAFQAVEASMVELIIELSNSDPEYIGALTAELAFNSKARALDVIFARFAQIHGLAEKVPPPDFHKLMGRVQKLAARRNDIVHSFYSILILAEGQFGVVRRPTKLKPNEGARSQPHEDIYPGQIKSEIATVGEILSELETYRLMAVDALYPS